MTMILQQDRHIQQMHKWLTRKVLDHLKEMLGDDRGKLAAQREAVTAAAAADAWWWD